MKIQKYDPTQDVVTAVTSIIKIATPKTSFLGKKARDRVARQVISACKGMMHDQRIKRPKT